ncbi:CoA transferase [Bradyrhizobium sp. URHD0069]|uniref:CoA transferase n=1 Tax=Bradyrhizobium sp. URHD0069 TaxID=1380355 RepID=UPI0012DF3E04|nr:CoA transferase [Bradyrhizobium sp. URHD0069]
MTAVCFARRPCCSPNEIRSTDSGIPENGASVYVSSRSSAPARDRRNLDEPPTVVFGKPARRRKTEQRKIALGFDSPSPFELADCNAIARPDLSEDLRFASTSLRAQYQEDLLKILEEVFADEACEGLLAKFRSAGVPCSPINGYTFGWFYPRKVASHCAVIIKVGAAARQAIVDRLEEAGIEALGRGKGSIRLNVKLADIDVQKTALSELLQKAEEWSHR